MSPTDEPVTAKPMATGAWVCGYHTGRAATRQRNELIKIMQVTPIADILAGETGLPILCVRGTLTELYDRKTGTGAKGEWAYQDAKLKDATAEIRLKIWNRDPIPKEMRGKALVLEATKNKKNQWSGVKTEEDSYLAKKGQHVVILAVNPEATIELANGSAQPATAPAPARPQAPQRPPEPEPPTNTPPEQPSEPEPPRATAPAPNGKSVRMAMNRFANLYLAALCAAEYVAETWNQQQTLDPTNDGIPTFELGASEVKDIATTFWIQGHRDGLTSDVSTGKFEFKH